MRYHLLFALLSGIVCTWSTAEYLQTVTQWPFLDFALPDRNFQENFRPENAVPTGIEVAWDRIYVSVPRLRQGVPATLTYFSRNIVSEYSNVQLHAYPSWEWHNAGLGQINCSQLISVYRMRLDKCNRLWVIDSGIMTSLELFSPVCPPKLLVFDTRSDQLVRQFVFPREALRPNTLLTNIVIDDTKATTCDNVFAYMTDTTGPGLVVFDGANDKSWRFVHASMYPHPDYATYQIADEKFELFDGIVGLTLSSQTGIVYYQPLATDRIFQVATSVLQRGPLADGEQLPVTLVGRKSSQGLALAVNPLDNTIYFSPFSETAIAAWKPYTNQQKIVVFDPQKLQFTAELRWIERDSKGGTLWVLSSRFQKFFNKRATSHEINIRIMRILVEGIPDERTAAFYRYIARPSLYQFYNNTLNF